MGSLVMVAFVVCSVAPPTWTLPIPLSTAQERLQEWLKQRETVPVSTISEISFYTGDVRVVLLRTLSRKDGDLYAITQEVLEQTEELYSFEDFGFGRNSRYCFSIRKERTGGVWVTGAVQYPSPSFEESVEALDPARRRLVKPQPPHLHVRSDARALSILDLNILEECKVIGTEEGDSGWTIKVQYRHRDQLREDKGYPAAATIRVRPDLHFLTDYCHIEYQGEGLRAVREFSSQFSGDARWPSATTSESTLKDYENGALTRDFRTVATHNTSWASLPEYEFTLSAFGLPEPFGVEWPRPTPWWLYLAGGTVFFFVLALLLGVAIRRLNARAAG